MANPAGMTEGAGQGAEQQTTQPFTPTNPLAAASVALLRERFADDIEDVSEHRGEATVIVRPQAITDICRALRDEPSLRYNFLADLTAVDWKEREPRYDVVYHLLSLETRAVLRSEERRVGKECRSR